MGIDPAAPTGAVRRRCPVAFGREAETERVTTALRDAELGTAVVAVSGDAGIGKTRLVEEVLERLAADVTLRRCGCHLADQMLPFGPFIDLAATDRDLEDLAGALTHGGTDRGDDDSALDWTAGEALSGRAVGGVLAAADRPAEAIAFLRESERQAASIGHLTHMVRAKVMLGDALFDIGDTHGARQALDEAIEPTSIRRHSGPSSRRRRTVVRSRVTPWMQIAPGCAAPSTQHETETVSSARQRGATGARGARDENRSEGEPQAERLVQLGDEAPIADCDPGADSFDIHGANMFDLGLGVWFEAGRCGIEENLERVHLRGPGGRPTARLSARRGATTGRANTRVRLDRCGVGRWVGAARRVNSRRARRAPT